ncbi:MAG: antitoxin family protein [Chloroflexota bacterium]|nr:antitoxin family protein [Chloroflexota bacterium]MDE2685332.1 antitoxin family protein [Chloroflexota bacterium]
MPLSIQPQTHERPTTLKTIKARCVNGALVPLEPVELREGDEYLITFDAPLPLSDEERQRLLRSTAGAWRKNDAYWEETQRMLYEARSIGSRIPLPPES